MCGALWRAGLGEYGESRGGSQVKLQKAIDNNSRNGILDPPGGNLSNIPLFWHLPTTELPSSGHKQWRRQNLANGIIFIKRYFCNLDFRLAPSAQKGLSATEQNTLVCFGIFVNIPSHKILFGPTHCFLLHRYLWWWREKWLLCWTRLNSWWEIVCFWKPILSSFVWQELSCSSTFTLTVIDFAHCSPPLFPLFPLKRFLVATPSLSLPTTPTTSSTSPKPRF